MTDLLPSASRSGGILPAVAPCGSYAETAAGLLQLLFTISNLELLMVTRVDLATDTQHVTARLVNGHPEAGDSVAWSGSLCVHMAQRSAPEIAPRLVEVPAYATAPNLVGTGLACYAGVSIYRGDGHLYGTVCGLGATPRDDSMHALLPSFRTVAALLGGALAGAGAADERLTETRARHVHQLSDALTDPVTGLANRTGLEQAVAREHARHLRYGHPVTVVVCDIDGLKTTNDKYGHAAGDALLRTVANRLREGTRASDVLGRLGGDEFLILLPGEHNNGYAISRLRDALADLPVSIGSADTRDHPTLAAARTHADNAMYQHKKASRTATINSTEPGTAQL